VATKHLSVAVTVTYDDNENPTATFDPPSIPKDGPANSFQFDKGTAYGTIKFKMSESSCATFNQPTGCEIWCTPTLSNNNQTLKLACRFPGTAGLPSSNETVNLSYKKNGTQLTFPLDPQVGNDGTSGTYDP
jgi:hypothetical protein